MIIFFDKFMNKLKELDFIELSWNRKWKEPGDFSLYLAAKDWDANVKYIKNVGRKEIGMVQKIIMTKEVHGTFITASGFFCEKMTYWGGAPYDDNFSKKFESGDDAFQWWRGRLRVWFKLNLNPNPYPQIGSIGIYGNIPPQIDYSVEKGTAAGTIMYNHLNGQERSFYSNIRIEGINGEPYITNNCVVYQGRDLRNKVYFGTGWGNVSKIEYLLDESAEYPYFEIWQDIGDAQGFSGAETTWKNDGTTRNIIKEIYVDEDNRPSGVGLVYPKKIIESSVSGIEIVATNESKIRAQMKEAARLEMLNNYKIETINVDVLQETFKYLRDYDLGDICSVVIDELEMTYSIRIIEVKEIHRKNAVEIQLVFGTPAKQKYVAINL